MSRKSKEVLDFERIIAEYQPQDDVFCEDDTVVARCKQALAALPPRDQRLFILYAEVGSIREVSRRLGMSPSTVQYRIFKIKKRLRMQVMNNL